MIVPVIAVGVVLLALLRKGRTDADTSKSDDTPEVPTVTWNDAWGKPNEWDRKHPSARVDKPLPVDWSEFDPTFAAKVRAAFADMERQGFDPYVFEGARTQQRQAYLYGQGRKDFPVYGRGGDQVTWTLDASKHGAYPARAVDVISKSTYWNDRKFFEAWGKAAKAQGLRWLGPKDSPHAELV